MINDAISRDGKSTQLNGVPPNTPLSPGVPQLREFSTGPGLRRNGIIFTHSTTETSNSYRLGFFLGFTFPLAILGLPVDVEKNGAKSDLVAGRTDSRDRA
jgi:hypothetical protein